MTSDRSMIASLPRGAPSKTGRPAPCIPDNAKKEPLEALVISVGSGKVLENASTQALSVKAGDRVPIGKYSGSDVKLDGDEHIVRREDDVLAILEE